MRASIAVWWALCVCLSATGAIAMDAPPVVTAQHCESCHGSGGDPAIPRLNGQNAHYLATRLKEFLDLPSQDPHSAGMGRIMSNVRDDEIPDIAAYFASQPPTQAKPHGGDGVSLYLHGAAAQRISSCATCHGPGGIGNDKAPRLAGQHGTYLKNQLERLRLLLRVSDPMFHNTRSMTDGQIAAIVAYLAND
jgi:cytochrome c553